MSRSVLEVPSFEEAGEGSQDFRRCSVRFEEGFSHLTEIPLFSVIFSTISIMLSLPTNATIKSVLENAPREDCISRSLSVARQPCWRGGIEAV